MRSTPLIAGIVTFAAALVMALPAGSAQSHHSICQLFPNDEFPGGNVWDFPETLVHGGGVSFDLTRTNIQGSANEESFEMGMDTTVDAIPVTINGHSSWRVVVTIDADWFRNVQEIPDYTNVELTVDGTFLLSGHELGTDSQTFVIQPGVLDQPVSALSPPKHQTITASFVVVPDGATGTLDQVVTRFAFRLNEPDPIASVGTLHVRLVLVPLNPVEPEGAMLEIPGACTGGHEHFADAHAEHHVQHEGSDAYADDPSHTHLGQYDEMCDVVDGYCNASKAASNDENAPEQVNAEASNAVAQQWAPAVVTASIGIAGLTYFRPRSGA